MKLSKLSQIVKRFTYLQIFTHGGVQWISVGGAAYPMYCVPTITGAEQLLAMMDVPADKREAYTVDFIEDPGSVFDDLDSDDTMLTDSLMLCQWRGRLLLPLFAEDRRTYWINERYMHPIAQAEEISFALRCVGEGMYAVAVFDGMSICAVIGVHIVHPEVTDMLADALEGDRRAKNYGYRISEDMVERLHGYQIPVTGIVNES